MELYCNGIGRIIVSLTYFTVCGSDYYCVCDDEEAAKIRIF